MYWNIYTNSRESSRASAAASRAESKAGTTSQQVKELERRVEALALACQSLWEITSEQLNITQDQLLEKMQEVDLRDGKADGRISSKAHTCTECGRNSNSQRETCIYCGATFPGDGHVFKV